MPLVTQIADAVAAEINAAPQGTFNVEFEAQRMVLPSFELAELAELKVTVVPKSIEMTAASRTMSQCDVQIDIGIQKKLGKEVDAEVEPLMELVEQIAAYLRGRQLQGFPNAAWVRAVNEPVYAADHLAEQRVFTSVLTLTYRVLR
ncbi:MAG TPA: hypothetical protein VM487_10905 [Phycisphaerae bacterium]|nr:hypothetical protein [Phycisphaerae bacterium]